jgi:hypothetical protein
MLANVTNKAGGARGFHTLDRGTVLLEAGASALLDLAEHPLHRAWVASGDATVAPLADKDAKAARKRIDVETEMSAKAQAQALAELPQKRDPA